MKSHIAISARDVTKDFHLPRHKSDSLKETITQVFKPKEKGVDVHHALRGISFEVKKGEFFGVLGRNGSGKSTLLKIISDIYRPTSGTVERNGTLVSFIELGVGFKGELTGRENVYLNGALLGFSKKEIDDRYDEIVQFAELEDFMDQRLKNYSSGMKVRLAFAVAIQAKSDILILDEVLAVGDAAFQNKCYDYFKTLKADKSKTIVFVTHSMNAVRDYCDRAILIEDGVIKHEGEASDVADEYINLFDKDKKDPADNSRGGNQEVVISKVETQIDSNKLTLNINLENQTDKVFDGLLLGLDIFDHNNKLVGGTVSHQTGNKELIKLDARGVKHITVEVDNIFGGGNYSGNMSVKLKDGMVTCDFWRKAFTFKNETDISEYFPVFFPAKIIIKTSEDSI